MNLRTIKIIAILTVVAVALASASSLLLSGKGDKIVLKVYTAGSLSEPFGNMENEEDMETIFETANPNVDVQVTSGGSADIIRRVTGLGHVCDVLASADFSLIPSMMINATPKMADFVIKFARNSMVLAYTNQSEFHEEINSTNWYEILKRDDVKFGFSNPNDDPCGYRAQMVILLAEQYYDDDRIYEDLVLNNTNMLGVEYDELNDTRTLNVPSELLVTDTDKIMMRSAEVDLTNALETGSIDYLFIYESVAYRHASSGERYIRFPAEINLNDTSHASSYAKIRVRTFADSENASKSKIIVGKPIVYGITIPSTAVYPELAMEFIRMVLTEDGQGVMSNAGQKPIVPGHAGYWKEAVPEGIRGLVS